MKHSIQLFGLLAILLFSNSSLTAQNLSLAEINRADQTTTKRSMIALGSWSIANMAVSGAMIGNSSGSEKHFHTMNVSWNVINLAIALPSYLGARKNDGSDRDLAHSLKHLNTSQKILLLNTGLDFGYIMGGLYMLERGQHKNDDRFIGFGQSVALQGAFLMVFDLVSYFCHARFNQNLFEMVASPGKMGVILHF